MQKGHYVGKGNARGSEMLFQVIFRKTLATVAVLLIGVLTFAQEGLWSVDPEGMPLVGVVTSVEGDEVVISVGSKDGVQGGDIFHVGQVETLGGTRPKARIKVVKVLEDRSTAAVIETMFFCYPVSIEVGDLVRRVNVELLVAFYSLDTEMYTRGDYIGTAGLIDGKVYIHTTDPKLEEILKKPFKTFISCLAGGIDILFVVTFQPGTLEHLKWMEEVCWKEFRYVSEIMEEDDILAWGRILKNPDIFIVAYPFEHGKDAQKVDIEVKVAFEVIGSLEQVVWYIWDFGDGGSGVGRRVEHTYAKQGVYKVMVWLIFDSGRVIAKELKLETW